MFLWVVKEESIESICRSSCGNQLYLELLWTIDYHTWTTNNGKQTIKRVWSAYIFDYYAQKGTSHWWSTKYWLDSERNDTKSLITFPLAYKSTHFLCEVPPKNLPIWSKYNCLIEFELFPLIISLNSSVIVEMCQQIFHTNLISASKKLNFLMYLIDLDVIQFIITFPLPL